MDESKSMDESLDVVGVDGWRKEREGVESTGCEVLMNELRAA